MVQAPSLRIFSKVLLVGLLVVVWLIAMVGLGILSTWVWMLPIALTSLLAVYAFRVDSLRRLIPVVGSVFCVTLLWYWLLRPSAERDWREDYSILPQIEIGPSRVLVKSLRNFHWRSSTEYDAKWEDRRYELDDLSSVELMVEPLGDSEWVAHVMLGFGFEGGERLIVSAEARKEVGERYGLLAGAMRQFELMYVFGTEADILDLRAVHDGSRLYAYPIKANKAFIRELFVDFCESANQLREYPRFYATLRRNCATTLLDHIDRVHAENIGGRYETIFPALTGKLLYDLGFMDTLLSFEDAQERFRIDEKARLYVGDARFSERIRE